MQSKYEDEGHTFLGGVNADGTIFSGVRKGTPAWDGVINSSTPADWVDPVTPQQKLEQQIATTDKAMARVVEDWIAAVAATNPAALQWIKGNRLRGLEKVNARRVLRGESAL